MSRRVKDSMTRYSILSTASKYNNSCSPCNYSAENTSTENEDGNDDNDKDADAAVIVDIDEYEILRESGILFTQTFTDQFKLNT